MSDFDFDELDKAVTGAIGDTPEPREEQPQQPQSPRTPAVPAANRGSGRFMDVVHPSSDMRASNPVRPNVNPKQRQPSAPEPAAELPSIPKPPSFFPSNAQNTQTESNDWSKPLESPFLPDAKVEKRPLGGTGLDFETTAPTAPEEPQELLEAPEEELLLEATTMPDPIEFAAQQPAAKPEVSEPAKEETPVVSQAPASSALETPEEPSTPIAITQQYKEKESTEQESGAIYDTESYHQPLVKPPKKRSGAWTVLWIALLVLLGAGVGVACYFYVLPLL